MEQVSASHRGFWSGKNTVVFAKISHISIVNYIENFQTETVLIYIKQLPEFFEVLYGFFEGLRLNQQKVKVTSLKCQDYDNDCHLEPRVKISMNCKFFKVTQHSDDKVVTISFTAAEIQNLSAALHLAVLNMIHVKGDELAMLELLAKDFVDLSLEKCENIIFSDRKNKKESDTILSFLKEKCKMNCYILLVSYPDLFACLVYCEKIGAMQND